MSTPQGRPHGAGGADDADDADDARESPLIRERRLLVAALTEAFAASSATRAATGAGESDIPDPAFEEPAGGAGAGAPGAAEAEASERHARTPGPAPGEATGAASEEATDAASEEATSAASEEPADAHPGVGCACCGCGSPRACAVCPICRGAAAALDPYLLERVADVAVLLADGLRAAARRLAAMDESGRRATGTDDEGSGT